MTAAVANLLIEQKATFRKRLVYRDKSKRPVNLTGFGARMQIRDAAGVLIVELSSDNDKIALGGAAGTIDLLLSATETSILTNIAMFYDLKLIAPNGDEIRLIQGKVALSLGQTT